jgi:uncharacterized membrane protein
MGQDTILKVLKEGLNMDDLMEKTKIPRSTLHFELERLEKKGLVESVKLKGRMYYKAVV